MKTNHPPLTALTAVVGSIIILVADWRIFLGLGLIAAYFYAIGGDK